MLEVYKNPQASAPQFAGPVSLVVAAGASSEPPSAGLVNPGSLAGIILTSLPRGGWYLVGGQGYRRTLRRRCVMLTGMLIQGTAAASTGLSAQSQGSHPRCLRCLYGPLLLPSIRGHDLLQKLPFPRPFPSNTATFCSAHVPQ